MLNPESNMTAESSLMSRLKAGGLNNLLPGALFAACILSMGEAQAVPWTQTGPLAYSTTQGTFGPNPPTSFDGAFSPFIGDKSVKIITTGGTLPIENTVTFEYDPVFSNPWRVNYDTAGQTNTAGNLAYRIKLDSSQDGLGVCATYNKCGPTFINASALPDHVSDSFIQKIYQASGDSPGTLLATINGAGSADLYSYGVNDLYVDVSWSQLQLTSGTAMGYSQVPAPLPILGTGFFFGSVRRLSRSSKRLRAAIKG